MHERREHPRASVILKVEYTSRDELLDDYLLDMSEGGLFVRTDVPFEPGTPLGFRLSFPGLLEPLALHGHVRWRRGGDEQGVGIEFSFDDQNQRRAVADIVARLRGAGSPSPPRGATCRVFIVEDNELMVRQFQRALRLHRKQSGEWVQGLDLVVAHDGMAAWNELQKHEFDLAIVDHFLPVMTGSELIARMRGEARFSHLPILATSGGGREAKEELLRAGADLFIAKPIQLQNLLATLSALMGTAVQTTAPSPPA